MFTPPRFGLPARLLAPLFVSSVVFLAGCSPEDSELSSVGTSPVLEGTWRAVLQSPGGELPFELRILRDDVLIDDGLRALALSADEGEGFSEVRTDGDAVTLAVDWYDSEIEARFVSDDRLEGRWRKTAAEGKDSTLDFVAERGVGYRFSADPAPELDVSGAWMAEFTDEDGTSPARAELVQEGARVTGTILTPTGDYRFLEGEVDGRRLRLSTFDGAHAFLFDSEVDSEERLAGDFWSRDSYHATWTARRAAPGEELPDPFEQVGLTNTEGRFSFSFPDLDGAVVTSDDPRFAGKPMLIDIFGTWCPNCNDAAPVVADWARRYQDRGLAVVGLAYEFTGDPTRDAEMVKRYQERHGASYLHLLAGTSDKEAASETLPDLTEILAFPTLVFLDRDHRVVRIYSGFAGPGTGHHFDLLKEQLEEILESLTGAEPSSDGAVG